MLKTWHALSFFFFPTFSHKAHLRTGQQACRCHIPCLKYTLPCLPFGMTPALADSGVPLVRLVTWCFPLVRVQGGSSSPPSPPRGIHYFFFFLIRINFVFPFQNRHFHTSVPHLLSLPFPQQPTSVLKFDQSKFLIWRLDLNNFIYLSDLFSQFPHFCFPLIFILFLCLHLLSFNVGSPISSRLLTVSICNL